VVHVLQDEEGLVHAHLDGVRGVAHIMDHHILEYLCCFQITLQVLDLSLAQLDSIVDGLDVLLVQHHCLLSSAPMKGAIEHLAFLQLLRWRLDHLKI